MMREVTEYHQRAQTKIKVIRAIVIIIYSPQIIEIGEQIEL